MGSALNGKAVKCTIAFGARGCSRRPNLLRRSRAGSTEAQVIALERAKTQSEFARRNHERALYLLGVAVVQADVDRGPAREMTDETKGARSQIPVTPSG